MKEILKKDFEKFGITIKVPEDNLKLFVDIKPNSAGLGITKELILSALSEVGCGQGVDLAILDDVVTHLNRGEEIVERRIKKGREPEPGSNGKTLLLIKKFTQKAEVLEDAEARASLTDLHLFDNVKKGQIVGRIYPPKPGKDGSDVFDRPIPAAQGDAAPQTIDPNTIELQEHSEANEKFQRVVALCDGFLSEEGGVLSIKDTLVVKGDLDFRFGNIDFVGKVLIEGDVHPGFSITAQKGIEVKGGVREAVLKSSEGNIVIKGFCFGGQKGGAVCKGNLTVRSAQELRAEALGDIFIEKESIDCTLRTQGAIRMGNGRLLGGEASVVCGVEASDIGNDAGKSTLVSLCNTVEISTEYLKLVVLVENHDKAIKLMELHLGPYANNASRVAFLKEPHKSKMQSMVEKLAQIKESRLKIVAKQKVLMEQGTLNATPRVNCSKMLHGGSRIRAGEVIFDVKDNLAGPLSIEFSYEKKEFEKKAMTALECAVPVTVGAENRSTENKVEKKGDTK